MNMRENEWESEYKEEVIKRGNRRIKGRINKNMNIRILNKKNNRMKRERLNLKF